MTNFFINLKEDDNWDEIEIEIFDEDDDLVSDEFDEMLDEIEFLYQDEDSDEDYEEERVLH